MANPITSFLQEVVRRPDRTREFVTQNALLQADLQEAMQTLRDLESSLENTGWARMEDVVAEAYTREGLRKMIRISRSMFIENPLINKGTTDQSNYVWGQGVTVTARHSKIKAIIEAFLADRSNRAEFWSAQARQSKDIELSLAGNNMFVLFPDQLSGRVQVRSTPVEQIDDIYCDPNDARDPWYYKRSWRPRKINPTTGMYDISTTTQTDWYPDWQYRPDSSDKLDAIGGSPVHWESPMYHQRSGGLDIMKFGLPDAWSAMAWARAARDDLQASASIHQALARFVWKLTVPGASTTNNVAAARTRLQSTASPVSGQSETNPVPPEGATFVQRSDVNMEPINTRGAAPDPEEGRRFWIMTASGVGVPVTFFGDVDIGNLATAKTLDRPTELKFLMRQEIWADTIRDLCSYAVDHAARTSILDLRADDVTDTFGQRRVVIYDDMILPEDADLVSDDGLIDRTVEVGFPPLLERDMPARVKALVEGYTLNGNISAGTMTPETFTRELLDALQVDDIEGEIDRLFPEQQRPSEESIKTAVQDLRRDLVPILTAITARNDHANGGH